MKKINMYNYAYVYLSFEDIMLVIIYSKSHCIPTQGGGNLQLYGCFIGIVEDILNSEMSIEVKPDLPIPPPRKNHWKDTSLKTMAIKATALPGVWPICARKNHWQRSVEGRLV